MLPNKFNGYDIAYLTVKYLMDTQTENEFNKLIRDNIKVKEIGKNIWKEVIKYFSANN